MSQLGDIDFFVAAADCKCPIVISDWLFVEGKHHPPNSPALPNHQSHIGPIDCGCTVVGCGIVGAGARTRGRLGLGAPLFGRVQSVGDTIRDDDGCVNDDGDNYLVSFDGRAFWRWGLRLVIVILLAE